ncbi:hypothetical protein T4D_3183 [Trichinella pseudospiralis]|uniref:Uncharacterized protein n=1 Tax=Trichinella pseudospiralis TaxID=6337 RepID=A0A0V1F4L6_TRIPS|nr:hypothetical protein T4D_3183 [Trichinella pseudospiralis]
MPRDCCELLISIMRVEKPVLTIHVNGISGFVKNCLTQPNTIFNSREAFVISAIGRLLVFMNFSVNDQVVFIVHSGTGRNFQDDDNNFVLEEVSVEEDRTLLDEESTEKKSESEDRSHFVQPETFIVCDGTGWACIREGSHSADTLQCFIDDEILEIICHGTL